MSNPFSNWSAADVSAHNARVRPDRVRLLGEETVTEIERGVEQVKREEDLHNQIKDELKRRGWYYVRSRMDVATTTALGVPDFIIAAADGRTFWIECKGRKTKTSPEQRGAIHWLNMLGHRAEIVRSMEEFLKIIS